MGKNNGKNINKNLIGKYSQKRLGHAKQSTTDADKNTSNKLIQKTAEKTGDLIGNKTADRSKEVSKGYRRIIQKQ